MNTSTLLCLVRHGETDWNATGLTQGSTDIPLNDTGRRQAADTGTVLAEEPWDALVASSLGRAIETAEIIGRHVGLSDIAIESRLVERGFGPAEGMRAEERKRMFPDKVIPGAETWEQVKLRTLEALEWVAAEYRGQRVVAVSHGGTILNLLAALSDGLYAPGTVVLENASMNLLEHNGERWGVRWCNRTTSWSDRSTSWSDRSTSWSDRSTSWSHRSTSWSDRSTSPEVTTPDIPDSVGTTA